MQPVWWVIGTGWERWGIRVSSRRVLQPGDKANPRKSGYDKVS